MRRISGFTVTQSHRFTVSQIPGFVELWNRWVDSARVSRTVSQLHKITETAILWNFESSFLAELAALRGVSGVRCAEVTQALKKCTISVKWREGRGVPHALTYLPFKPGSHTAKIGSPSIDLSIVRRLRVILGNSTCWMRPQRLWLSPACFHTFSGVAMQDRKCVCPHLSRWKQTTLKRWDTYSLSPRRR